MPRCDKCKSSIELYGARDGKRVLDVYVKPLTAQEMIDLSRKLTEAAGIIRARGGE